MVSEVLVAVKGAVADVKDSEGQLRSVFAGQLWGCASDGPRLHLQPQLALTSPCAGPQCQHAHPLPCEPPSHSVSPSLEYSCVCNSHKHAGTRKWLVTGSISLQPGEGATGPVATPAPPEPQGMFWHDPDLSPPWSRPTRTRSTWTSREQRRPRRQSCPPCADPPPLVTDAWGRGSVVDLIFPASPGSRGQEIAPLAGGSALSPHPASWIPGRL